MKQVCMDKISTKCATSTLLNNIVNNGPAKVPLPVECQGVNPNDEETYMNCFKWLNKNLIRFTIFPDLKKIEQLQTLINGGENNGETTARFLQVKQSTTKTQIVATDASQEDKEALMPKDSTTIDSSEMEIDGAGTDTVKEVVDDETAPVVPGKTPISASFNKLGYLFTFLLAIFML